MRVALITNIPTPYRMPLFRELSRREGVELRVFFEAQSERNRKWRVATEQDDWAAFLKGRTINLGRQDLIALHFNFGVVRALKRFRPSVVVLGGYNSFAHLVAWMYCLVSQTPYLLWNGSTMNEKTLARTLAMPIIRRIVSKASGYVSYGSAASDYLVSCGAPRSKIWESFNTVDVRSCSVRVEEAKARGRTIRARFGIAEGRVVLLYVGQLIRRKGVRELLTGFAEAEDLHGRGILLVVAGDGPLRAELEREVEAKELGAEVLFLGHRTPEEVQDLFSVATAVILPSMQEVWGLAVNEAMASGCIPIVSSRCGCTRDLVNDGVTGLVIEPTGDGISEGICRLMELGGQRAEMMAKQAQVDITSKFTIEAAADAFIAALQNVRRAANTG